MQEVSGKHVLDSNNISKNNSNVNSITNAQEGIHKNLEKVVEKHFNNRHRKPIAQHTQDAFDSVSEVVEAHLKEGRPLIFDSCCGTAMSTQIIALENPEALVLGIDRSSVRLAKETNLQLPDNVILIQAECADFWSLAVKAGWKLDKHTILYPNPYPKSKHLQRRWHGHPSFPTLLALGGEIELRSNWNVYIEEFCAAVNFVKQSKYRCDGVEVLKIEKPLTLFEKKYQESGQNLYVCRSYVDKSV